MERKNKDKKEGIITIKTIKRGKVRNIDTQKFD